MKKKTKIILVAVIIVAILVLSAALLVLFKNKSVVKINELGLTSKDVPNDYVKGPEYYNQNAEAELGYTYPGISEAYYVYFEHNSDASKRIVCAILKFKSADFANNSYDFYTPIGSITSDLVDVVDVGTIGEESIVQTANISDNGINYYQTMVNFRISDIIVSVITILDPSEDNLLLTVNLAKIVEQRIYDNII